MTPHRIAELRDIVVFGPTGDDPKTWLKFPVQWFVLEGRPALLESLAEVERLAAEVARLTDALNALTPVPKRD